MNDVFGKKMQRICHQIIVMSSIDPESYLRSVVPKASLIRKKYNTKVKVEKLPSIYNSQSNTPKDHL